MDSGRSNARDAPIPSRRSTGSGRQPDSSQPSSGTGTPTRDQGSPTPEDRTKLPPPSRTHSTDSSGELRSPVSAGPVTGCDNPHCQKCVPQQLPQESYLKCIPAYMAHYRHYAQIGGQQAPSDPMNRQSTFIQADARAAYGQQEVNRQQGRENDEKSQRSKSASTARPSVPPKKAQKNMATPAAERPPWRGGSRSAVIPSEPFKTSKPTSAVTPVRHHSEISATQSQISAGQSIKTSQGTVRQGAVNARHIQLNDQLGIASPAELRQSSETRQSSQESESAGPLDDTRSLENSLQHTRLSSNDEVPIRRSSERVNVQRVLVEDSEERLPSRPIHFENELVRIDAENTPCTTGPDLRSSERIREECEAIMQKLTAEIALSGDFPSKDRLCVKVSLGEQLTADGHRKSYTICEPPRLLTGLPRDDGPVVNATPSASSPRLSGQFGEVNKKHTESIPEAPARELPGADVKDDDKELEETIQFPPSSEEDSPLQHEVLMPPSIEEIFPPRNAGTVPPKTTQAPSVEEIMGPANESFVPFLTEPMSSTPEAARTDYAAKRTEDSPDESRVHRDRESTRETKTKTSENEALNTEFLYYSSALKNHLPALSCAEDRCRLVPWVKKLFSPEYCARLLRDKRNRFLLHLVLVLCNDEVIGVFRKPPPGGSMPSVEELCSARYPPAAWECDSAWQDHLEDTAPGVAQMPCPWHPSGCPAPENRATVSNQGLTCPEICHPWQQSGTGSEAALGWSLDQEFKLLLYLSRPLKPLRRVSRDRQRMTSWLRFLCTVTPDCCIDLRSLRNDYAKLLLAYSQDDRMTGPFANDPVWGLALPPLGNEGDSGQARPFADPASGDVDEFLRTVSVPNEGAFCYVAVDGIPVATISRPTASASLLRR